MKKSYSDMSCEICSREVITYRIHSIVMCSTCALLVRRIRTKHSLATLDNVIELAKEYRASHPIISSPRIINPAKVIERAAQIENSPFCAHCGVLKTDNECTNGECVSNLPVLR
jgi:hypothetical protein